MTDPQRLIDELVRGGWTVAGRGRGHIRLDWPTRLLRDRSLVVPTDTTAPESEQMWQAVRAQLEDAVEAGVKAAHVLTGVCAAGVGQAQRATPTGEGAQTAQTLA